MAPFVMEDHVEKLFVVLLLVVLAAPAHAEIIYSLGDTYIESRKDKPYIYDWHIGGESCAAMVLSSKLVNVVCSETGQEMMLYMSGSKVVVARKGGTTKKYARGKTAYGMYQAIVEHARDNDTVVQIH